MKALRFPPAPDAAQLEIDRELAEYRRLELAGQRLREFMERGRRAQRAIDDALAALPVEDDDRDGWGLGMGAL